MGQIRLTPPAESDATIVSNVFIDEWLPRANGEFVKVYIYLLRVMQQAPTLLDTNLLADDLFMMESDIIRALKYWEQSKVLSLEYNNKSLIGIHLLSLQASSDNKLKDKELKDKDLKDKKLGDKTLNLDLPHVINKSNAEKSTTTPVYDEQAYKQLVYFAEALFGKVLSSTDTDIILSLVDTYSLPFDVAEYLIELCAIRNKNLQYMEKVATDWANHEIATVEQAKQHADQHNGNYYRVFKALGIFNHQPQNDEKQLIDKWIKEYNFAIEIVERACGITITTIHDPSLKYTDKILTSWYNNGTMSLQAIEAAEERFKAAKATTTAATTTPTVKSTQKNRFHNNEQRSYDFDYLEKRMNDMLDKKITN